MVHISTNALITVIGKEHSEVEAHAQGLGITVVSTSPLSSFLSRFYFLFLLLDVNSPYIFFFELGGNGWCHQSHEHHLPFRWTIKD